MQLSHPCLRPSLKQLRARLFRILPSELRKSIMRFIALGLVIALAPAAHAQEKLEPRKFSRDQLEGMLKKDINLSADDVKFLRFQVMACWPKPKDATPEVTVHVKYTVNGNLDAEPVLINRKDTVVYLEAAAAAVKAVTACQPIKMPRAKYEAWKAIDIVFYK